MADTIKTATGRVHALLDAAMAAFAAGAVGFAGFVMPAGIVVPGGQVGRAAISLGAALATFLGVLLLLRELGGPTRLRKSGSLRLRRADMHPDAPARSPILAARELGVPLDELALDAHTAEAIDLEAAEDDAEREHAPPDFTPAEGEMPATAEALPKNGLPFWIADDAPPEVAEIVAGPPDSNEVVAEIATPPPMPFWVEEPPGADELLLDQLEPVLRLADEPTPDASGERLRSPDGEPESLDGLVDRLETGVLRRKRGGRAAAEAAEREQDRALEDRLRGAISDLRRMARG